MTKHNDPRFDVALYNVGEASHYLRLSPSTLRTWVDGYSRGPASDGVIGGAPVITAWQAKSNGGPRLPFIGLAEAYVLNAFRRAGVPLQRIRPALEWLKKEVGPHALASKDLYTDGAEVLWNFAARSGDSADGEAVKRLIVPRLNQYIFRDVVEQYLKQVSFGGDGFAELIHLPQFGPANVVLDPTRNFGHPIFAQGGAAVNNVLGRIRAGESIEEAAEDFGLSTDQLSAVYLLSA